MILFSLSLFGYCLRPKHRTKVVEQVVIVIFLVKCRLNQSLLRKNRNFAHQLRWHRQILYKIDNNSINICGGKKNIRHFPFDFSIGNVNARVQTQFCRRLDNPNAMECFRLMNIILYHGRSDDSV